MTCNIIIVMQARHCLLPYPVSHDMLHHHRHAGKTLFVTLPCVPCLTLCPMTCYIIIIQVVVTLSYDMLHHYHHHAITKLVVVVGGGVRWNHRVHVRMCPCVLLPACPGFLQKISSEPLNIL